MTDSILKSLQGNGDLFWPEFQRLPSGRYAHIVLLRETESFPIFQTDGGLNVIPTRAGLNDATRITRLVMFKRKQSTPERLRGRELLRSFELISDEGDRRCVYNETTGGMCGRCPDCILYGYAIGNGAEKSKVLVDSAFSITPYEISHKSFKLNAPYEDGTMMNDEGQTKSSFQDVDHIVPQVFFPAIVTLRDPTYEGFLYVLGNVLRNNRYGAQDTRTGKVFNHVVAIAFTNGEIFSNLRYSQTMHDALDTSKLKHEIERDAALSAAQASYSMLMKSEPVAMAHDGEFANVRLGDLLGEVNALYQNAAHTRELIVALDEATRVYAVGGEAAEGAPKGRGRKKK